MCCPWAGSLAIIAALAGAGTAAASERWEPPVPVGLASSVAVAEGPGSRDGLAVLTVRRASSGGRGSVVALRRTGPPRGAVGRALVLARTDGWADSIDIDVRPGGDAVAAWSAYAPSSRPRGRGNHRTFAVRLPQRASGRGIRALDLSGGGRSSFVPRFLQGVGGPLLVWRRHSGPLESARWQGSGPPVLGDVDLPVDGGTPVDAAGDRRGRVLAAFVVGRRLRVALGVDAGRRFTPPVGVEGSSPVLRGPAVAVDSSGAGALTWAQHGDRGPATILASVVGRDGSAPTAATTLATPSGAPSVPVIAAREGAGAFVGWIETRRRSGISSSPGPVMVGLIDGGGEPDGDAVRLGGPGEKGHGLQLVARGGHGATALWVTPSGVLRAQDVDLDGRLGRTYTLDRGVTWHAVRTARRGGAVAYLAGDHARLVRRVGS
jgi:hypothetical protein